MQITSTIHNIGVNDRAVDLFEGQYRVPNGMAYNSYLILDEKVAVLDTVEQNFAGPWLENLAAALGGKTPDYLIVQHMEPDHSGSIQAFMSTYPQAVLVASAKAFPMLANFFGEDFAHRRQAVGEGDRLSLGGRELTFITAPMVHWPEVIMTYSPADRVLFSADAFGKFGALDADEEWDCEARRYYFGIVGKYGPQVQAVLKKAAALDIGTLCPLHGPTLTGDLSHYLSLYDCWSSYGVEREGVVIAFTSVYGHTRIAAQLLAQELEKRGCPKVVLHDLARTDLAEAVEDAFRYGKLVLATTTYNADIFPFMREFIQHLKERNFQNRTVGLVENGSWAPMAAKGMRSLLEGGKNLRFTETTVRLLSAVNEETRRQLAALAEELMQ